jgi:methionyl aminopeptidase
MVVLKSPSDIKAMMESGKISAQALKLGGEAVKPGITTRELDRIIHNFILKMGAKPSFLGYAGFPASACISVNNEIIHGIPSDRIIAEGDIVSIDVGAFYKGFHTDNAATFAAGLISSEAQLLIDATKESLRLAIDAAKPGNRIGDIGYAVESYVEKCGYSVVRQFIGHGVGFNLHEEPEVPNFGTPGRGVRLLPGMTLAIEPMVNLGKSGVITLQNKWTVVTADGSLSAHFENSVVITDTGAKIITRP